MLANIDLESDRTDLCNGRDIEQAKQSGEEEEDIKDAHGGDRLGTGKSERIKNIYQQATRGDWVSG